MGDATRGRHYVRARLRVIRSRAGMTVSMFAQETGLTPTRVAQIENGAVTITTEEAQMITDVTGIPVKHLKDANRHISDHYKETYAVNIRTVDLQIVKDILVMNHPYKDDAAWEERGVVQMIREIVEAWCCNIRMDTRMEAKQAEGKL